MMPSVFIEVIMDCEDMDATEIESRDDVEELLEEALMQTGLGKITGAGSGFGKENIDISIHDKSKLDTALSLIRDVLQKVEVPRSTFINVYVKTIYQVYD